MPQATSKAPSPAAVVVLGDGVAALMSTLALCRTGLTVDLLSAGGARRWHGPHTRVGLNAVDLAADGAADSFASHVRDTCRVGRQLARRPLVEAMVHAAPSTLDQLRMLGVPLDRTPSGSLTRRRLPGSKQARAVSAGSHTGAQVLHALDDHLRRLENTPLETAQGGSSSARPQLQRYEHWEIVSLVIDDAAVVGCVAQHLHSMKLRAFPAQAVVLATGAPRMLFGAPAASPCPDHAVAVAYRHGAVVANADLAETVTTDLPEPTRSRTEHQMVGGLWTDAHWEDDKLVADSPRNHSTNLLGLYAVGGACHAYHGARPLAGNELLASLFGASLVGPAVQRYCAERSTDDPAEPDEACKLALGQAERAYRARLVDSSSARDIRDELIRAVGEWRDSAQDEEQLGTLADAIAELRANRGERTAPDSGRRSDRQAVPLRHLDGMLDLADVIVTSARSRLGERRPSTTLARRGADGAAAPVDELDYESAAGTVTVGRIVAADDDGPTAATAAKTSKKSRAGPAATAADELPKNIPLRIRRQDGPDRLDTRRWELFVVPTQPAMTVAAALRAIDAAPRTKDGTAVAPVVWEGCCDDGACGGCAMLIDGVARLACTTRVSDVLRRRRPISLEPLSKFPLVRDLVVDRSRIAGDLAALGAWPPAPPAHPPSEPHSRQLLRRALMACHHCGICLEACPEYHPRRAFVGAAAIARAHLLTLHPAGPNRGDDLVASLMEPGGIADCGKAFNCVEVCPQQLPLDESLGAMARATTQRLLSGKRRK